MQVNKKENRVLQVPEINSELENLVNIHSDGHNSEAGGFGPKPVEIGKEYIVDITEISRLGDGVARVQGFVVFVKNGKIGQNVKVKVTYVGKKFAVAEVV
jgi:predicted RNA-binding protein with TRAM domain